MVVLNMKKELEILFKNGSKMNIIIDVSSEAELHKSEISIIKQIELNNSIYISGMSKLSKSETIYIRNSGSIASFKIVNIRDKMDPSIFDDTEEINESVTKSSIVTGTTIDDILNEGTNADDKAINQNLSNIIDNSNEIPTKSIESKQKQEPKIEHTISNGDYDNELKNLQLNEKKDKEDKKKKLNEMKEILKKQIQNQ